jgi:hypothetical protein
MSNPRPIALSEFSLRVAARPANGDWFVLVTPAGQLQDTLETLSVDIEAFTGSAPKVVDRIDNAREFFAAVRGSQEKVTIIAGFESFSAAEWQLIDQSRSGLEGAHAVVLIATRRQLDLIVQDAPNLASWLTGGIWRLGDDIEQMSTAEVQERLASLRRATGLTDENVIERATEGKLEHDAQFTEWLLLLGRGDLIGRR